VASGGVAGGGAIGSAVASGGVAGGGAIGSAVASGGVVGGGAIGSASGGVAGGGATLAWPVAFVGVIASAGVVVSAGVLLSEGGAGGRTLAWPLTFAGRDFSGLAVSGMVFVGLVAFAGPTVLAEVAASVRLVASAGVASVRLVSVRLVVPVGVVVFAGVAASPGREAVAASALPAGEVTFARPAALGGAVTLADPVALVGVADFTVAGLFDGPGVVTASVVPSGLVGGSVLGVPPGGDAAAAGVVFADGATRGAVASVSGATGTVRADGRAASASVVGRVVRVGGPDVSVSSGDAGAAGRIVFGGCGFTDAVSAGAGAADRPALAGTAGGVASVVVVSAAGPALPVATGFEGWGGVRVAACGRAGVVACGGDEPEDGDVTGGSVGSSGSGRAIGCVEVFVSAVPGPSGSAASAIP
jgi:hypothetical protein